MNGTARTSESTSCCFVAVTHFSRNSYDHFPSWLQFSIWDPARSNCAAEERDGLWMTLFFERRAREEDDAYVASQGSMSSHCEKITANVRPAFVRRHQEYTERDTVLQNLIDRSEDKAANTSDNASSGKKTWVSKWDFNFDKSEKLEFTGEKKEDEQHTQPIKPNSPNKMKMLKSPTKMKLLKSPTKISPPNMHKAKSECKKPQSPYKKIHMSPLGSSCKQCKHRKPFDKSKRNKPHSPNEEMHKSPPGSRGKKRQNRKSFDKSERNKPHTPNEEMHKSPPGSSGKKRQHRKSLDKSECNKPRGPNKDMRKWPSGSNGKQSKDKSLDKWHMGKTGETENHPSSERGSSDKKRKLGKSAKNSEAKAGKKNGGPIPPHVKKRKDGDDSVVDLTFSDSDSV
jgi:hypothetical protein